MLNFFRRIRRKLSNENKFIQYSRYAIGEIVLVMVGILLALQVNTWNEERKDRKLENNILEDLVENLEQNCNQLERRIKSISYYRKFGGVFISAIENNKTYHDSLENHFHLALMNTSNIKLSNIGYEALKNVGLEIVRNKILKKDLIIFFEEIQPKFHASFEWGDIDRANREKYIDEHFIQIGKDKAVYYKPFDPNILMKDNYFAALIYKTDLQRNYFTMVMEDHLKESQRLLKIIKSELEE